VTTDTLRLLQQQYAPAVEREVRRWLSFRRGPGTLYGMLSYQMGHVDGSLNPERAPTGKQFRPILSLLACEAVGGTWEDALPAAAAIELLHNFSLIHDDIEDQDPSRRHRATVWKLWGEAQAINAGDSMFALAGRALLETQMPTDALDTLARRFHDMSLSLTEGQFLDMQFESRQDVTPEEYLDMIGRKTGALVAFSCFAGAIIGGASDQVRDALHDFGGELGMAFQIQDDIQGIWGHPDATGKAASKDLENRKKTLPVLLALQRAQPEHRQLLRDFYSQRSDDLSGIKAILNATNARVLSEDVVRRLQRQATSALETANLDQRFLRILEALIVDLTGQ
jgi:geranylgeranyl diphosphate synthase type I